jgi:hypothetical protein
MKIGLDIHGVIDTNPKFFAEFSKAIISSGGEVHVITGPKRSAVEADLKTWGISYTHFFSIVDSVDEDAVRWEDKDNPWVDSEIWDRRKARYCKEHGIDLHIDDSDEYGKYFKTPYARFFSKDK